MVPVSRQSVRKPGRPKDPQLTAQRQEQILAAAALEFAAAGYHGCDVQLVADRAGVGKGTVYRYFSSKEILFCAAIDQLMLQLTEIVNQRADQETDPLQRIAGVVRAYFAFFDQHRELVELMILERAEFKDRKQSTYFVHRERNIAPWRDLTQDLVASGQLRQLPVDTIMDRFSDMLYGTIFTAHMAGRKRPFADQADEIIDIIMHGIAGPNSGQLPPSTTRLTP